MWWKMDIWWKRFEENLSWDSSYNLLFLLATVQQEAPEHEQLLNPTSSSQQGQMDQQRCSQSPVKTGQIESTPAGWTEDTKIPSAL